MSIGLVIPSIRPIMVDRVLHDLHHQTLKPDFVILVDNSTRYVRKQDYDYDLIIKRPGKNIGTNAVWNMALRLKTNYVGFVGDDYRLDNTMIEKLVYGLEIKNIGATVPELIQQKKRTPPKNTYIDLKKVGYIPLKTGKGNSSAVLMKREVAYEVPEIPDHFKIFFGDNWISLHIIHVMRLKWVMMKPCHIYHIPNIHNVSAKLGYKKTLREERHHWDAFIREHRSNKVYINPRS